MTRKTSTSKSRTTSSKTSTGKKVTNSRGVSKQTKSSSLKSTTQRNLKKNQQSLTTTGTQSKKKQSTNTSTAKAKVKSTKTSTNNTKRSSTRSPQKRKDPGIKVMNSRKIELFPHHQTFPIFLEDQTEKKRCWFTCVEHAQKYVDRYSPKYKCYQYTGK